MFTIVTCAEDELAARVSQHLFKRALAENSTADHVRANVTTLQFVGLEGHPGWTLNRDLNGVLDRHGKRIGIHPPRGMGGNALRAYRIVRFAQTLRHGLRIRLRALREHRSFSADSLHRLRVQPATSRRSESCLSTWACQSGTRT